MADERTETSPAADGGRACRHWNGARTRYCSSTDDVHLYPGGLRCKTHTPAALAGRPEASGQYCAPARHYCIPAGNPCPAAPADATEAEEAA
ncbi:hypothetical protein GCM10009530_63400 [Microbispora corallina]|uniref:Uncharacterized protein n=1 Tax=Microbispora corallina TaxID=83302 RepID=A0ABQ4GBM1_9ACTN|nr:hypothetical protein [Microbispora corallina]GIH44430.1 hypothetical protein Mco01_74300 [Microbispora corallina]